MTAPEAGATRAARAVVRALVAQGVRDVVLCPGSRSAPLAHALLAAEEAGWLRLHVRVDERSAAFLALGLTRTDDGARPAAVVTTSGTAVANLHPAVLEASHAGRPLLVVTADRPHELRGTGANQTTEQVGIFAGAVRRSLDVPALDAPPGGPPAAPGEGEDAGARSLAAHVARAVAAATGARTGDPGPVHVNVALREPLTAAAPWVPGPPPGPHPAVDHVRSAPPATRLRAGPRTVVLAGDGAGATARHVAERAGWPLLAEPTSGARCGPAAIGPYRLLLGEPLLADAVERVVVLGHPTLSRPVARLLARRDVEVVVVAPTGAGWTDVAGVAARVCGAVEPEQGSRVLRTRAEAWERRWRAAGAAAEDALARHLAELDAAGTATGLGVARAVAAASAAPGTDLGALVVGASMAVRDLDLAAAPPAGDGPRVLANRGLAGIDGTVSTAAGVALAGGGPVRALVGDLTFLHDLGALALGSLEREPDLQVVVVNDDGGAIFATLEHGEPGGQAAYERLFGTPQALDLEGLAAGFAVPFTRAEDLARLREVLGRPVRGRSVVEIRTDRRRVRERLEALRAAASVTIAGALRTAG
jgi:2-succinyl-5-enolpyruvyl-6-hydroxy-3-cyclohexene-1-carboxylate synthase